MEYSAFIDMNLLSEEAKIELENFYEYLLFKYKRKKRKDNSEVERFEDFANKHLIELPDDYKFDRYEAHKR